MAAVVGCGVCLSGSGEGATVCAATGMRGTPASSAPSATARRTTFMECLRKSATASVIYPPHRGPPAPLLDALARGVRPRFVHHHAVVEVGDVQGDVVHQPEIGRAHV